MEFFWSLFSSRTQYRHYALVDQTGICRAFKQCSQAPLGQDWIEVHEHNLSWLDQPLPAGARLTRRAARPAARQLRIA